MKPVYKNSLECQNHLQDIEALDFFLAREICARLDSDNEILFHLVIALSWGLRQGHITLPLADLAGKTLWQAEDKPGFSFPSHEQLMGALLGLQLDEQDNMPLVLVQNCLYLRRYWSFEGEIATAIRERIARRQVLSKAQISNARQCFSYWYARSSTQQHIDWQQVAIANAPGQYFYLLAGGPGTGKTYTAARILAIFLVVYGRLRISLAAPTGKAAQRLYESLLLAREHLHNPLLPDDVLECIFHSQPQTLHRLLGLRPDRNEAKYHQRHVLPCDLLLIDEASMIDMPMMARILRALPPSARLILLGDPDQLPSVESGAVLSDLAALYGAWDATSHEQIQAISGIGIAQLHWSRKKTDTTPQEGGSCVACLYHTHRFQGVIADLARSVIARDGEQSWQIVQRHAMQANSLSGLTEKNDLIWMDCGQERFWLKKACQQFFLPISRAATLADAFAAFQRFRIITPMRVGALGVMALNQFIEQKLRAQGVFIRTDGHYQGRPIMITSNDYHLQLFNGDTGIIWRDASDQRLYAFFEQEQGNWRKVSLGRLPPVETVYAMSIHKTQGSEFDQLFIILPDQDNDLLSAQLLYTGITRARKRLFINVSRAVWQAAVSRQTMRYSRLAQRIQETG